MNTLLLLGYDYLNALKEFVGKPHFFCVIYQRDLKHFQDSKISEFKSIMGQRLILVSNNENEILNIIETHDIYLIVTLGWRFLLDITKYKRVNLIVNVHPALLPEYKGYHPVPFVILNEEKLHGITAHLINNKMDAGGIVLKESFSINEFSTVKSLQDMVNKLMPSFLGRLFSKLENPNIPIENNNPQLTKVIAPKRKPEDSEIKLGRNLKRLFLHVKSCDNERFPAYFYYKGQKIFITMNRSSTAERDNQYDL